MPEPLHAVDCFDRNKFQVLRLREDDRTKYLRFGEWLV